MADDVLAADWSGLRTRFQARRRVARLHCRLRRSALLATCIACHHSALLSSEGTVPYPKYEGFEDGLCHSAHREEQHAAHKRLGDRAKRT